MMLTPPAPPRLASDHTDVAGTTAVIAAFASADTRSAEPHDALFRDILVDTIGVALAARGRPGGRILRLWSLGERPVSGRSTVWASGESTTAAWAALLNADLAHELDYDDISPGMPMHPSAVLIPALVAAAEENGTAAGRMVEAYDVGAAVFRALTETLSEERNYGLGWHTTSTVGRLAGVCALGRLLRVDALVLRNALGIASSLASGSRANFGSMTKPLHAGVAARDAVVCVQLAQLGFTANLAELEAEGGFLRRFGGPVLGGAGLGDASLGDTRLGAGLGGASLGETKLDVGLGETVQQRFDAELAGRLTHWQQGWPHDWGLKRYPACYGAHRAIDAALALRPKLAGRLPERVQLVLHPTGMRPLLPHRPENENQAKFSVEYCVAVALLDGSLGFSAFTAQAFARAEVQNLAQRISVSERRVPPIGATGFVGGGYAVVEAILPGGESFAERVDITRGTGDNPMSQRELRDKFDDCCAHAGLEPGQATRLFGAVQRLSSGAGFDSFASTVRFAAEPLVTGALGLAVEPPVTGALGLAVEPSVTGDLAQVRDFAREGEPALAPDSRHSGTAEQGHSTGRPLSTAQAGTIAQTQRGQGL